MAFGGSFAGMLGGAGGGSVVGGAVVRLLLDAAKFEAGLKSAQGRMAMLGTGMTRVGSALTKGLTLPVVAAAGASVKLAMDFEQAFTRIDAASNASAKDIAKWKGEVLGLAGETGKAPQELAEALFFLASAGLKASEIMPTLEMSAKASAAGMGSLVDVAKLTAVALNNYRQSGLTAAKATDILVAAVKAGTAEPEEFAAAMGAVLPIASKAKVSYGEVAASLAALSTVGFEVNEGVTIMSGLLMALQAPGSLAAKSMKEVGISADEMRASIADEGVVKALLMLEEATGGNIDTLHKIIPNIRGLRGQLSLMGENADAAAETFRNVTHASGEAGQAFRDTEKDAAFRFQQTLAKLKVAAIEVGQTLLPVVTEIVEVIGDLAKKFSEMDPKAKAFWIKLVLIGAALGPVIGLLGGIVRLAAPVVGAFTRMATAAATTATATTAAGTATTTAAAATVSPLAVWAVGLAGVAMGATAAYRANKDLLAQDLAGKFHESAEGIRFMAIASIEAGQGQRALANILDNVTGLTKDQELKMAAMVETLHKWGGGLNQNQRHMINNLLVLGDYNGALKLLRSYLDGTIGPLAKNRKGIDDAKGAAADAEQKVKAFGRSVKDLPDGKAVKITADTSQALAMLRGLQDKYRAIKHEIENTIHVNVVPGDIPVALKPGGGGGGAGSAQQLGIRTPTLAVAAGGGGDKYLTVNVFVDDESTFTTKVEKAITTAASRFAGV